MSRLEHSGRNLRSRQSDNQRGRPGHVSWILRLTERSQLGDGVLQKIFEGVSRLPWMGRDDAGRRHTGPDRSFVVVKGPGRKSGCGYSERTVIHPTDCVPIHMQIPYAGEKRSTFAILWIKDHEANAQTCPIGAGDGDVRIRQSM